MKIIAIIPARYDSVRFPGKPLVDIRGKPMIQHVYEQASKAVKTVMVATDDERIFKTVQSFKGRVVMTSADHQTGTERCDEALFKIENKLNQIFDIVINIQGDEPFIQPQQITALIKCFVNPKCQIATLAKKIETLEELNNLNVVKVVKTVEGKALYFSRSIIPCSYNSTISYKNFSEASYYKHIGIYAYHPDTLHRIVQLVKSPLEKMESLEQLRWLENGYTIYIKDTDIETKSIDTPEDLAYL